MFYEKMEESKDVEILTKDRAKKKKSIKKLLNNKIFKLLIFFIIIFPILFILYYYIHNNKYDNKDKSKQYEELNNNNNNKNQNISKLNNNKNLTLELVRNLTYEGPYSLQNKNRYKFNTHSISQFPSGKLISIDVVSINIFDINYNLIQKIYTFDVKEKFPKTKLFDLVVRDENTFSVSTNEGDIKIFNKNLKNEKFELKQHIKASNAPVRKLIFDSKNKLYSGSYDDIIKIWEENEKGEYINIKSINSSDIFAIMLLEDKNLLISKSRPKLYFYDIKNDYNLITTVDERSMYNMERLDNDKILIYHDKYLKVISLDNYNLIKKVNIGMKAFDIKYYKEKGIILIGGSYQYYKDWEMSLIKIYRSDNFELINTIENTNGDYLYGLYILKNGLIASYGSDGDENGIKLWKLNEIN